MKLSFVFFKLVAITFFISSILPTSALAQIRPNRRLNRTKPYKRRNYGRTKHLTGSGSVAAAGSAKDDPDFNTCKNIPSWRKLKVTLKPEATLADLIGWISKLTCKKFIVPSGIRAQKITFYSPSKITPYQAYKAFLSALTSMNLTIQKSGSFYKIVEISKVSKGGNGLVKPGESFSSKENVLTAIIKIKYATISDVVSVLEKFKSQSGNITVYEATNIIIITDFANNIKRMMRLLKYLDVEDVNNERVWVIKIKHAEVEKISGMISEIFSANSKSTSSRPSYSPKRKLYRPALRRKQSTGTSTSVNGKGTISKIITDERTNSIILVTDSSTYLQVLALIKKIDVPLPGGKEKIHIVYLENANADDMAGLLGSITGSGSSSRRSYSRNKRRTSRTSRRSSYRRGSYGRNSNVSEIFKGPVMVQPDASTNSLVIVASAKDFLELKKIIKKLDKPRRQVFVEVSILEVSLNKTRNLGLSFHGGDVTGSGDQQSLIFGGSITDNSTNSIMMNPLSLMGLAVGLRGPEIQNAESILGIPGFSFPSFGVFFQALQSNNAVNVVSTPHILTTDNEKAEIMVGENVPFQSGISSLASMASMYGGSTGASMYPGMASIQRQDVALKLSITPHVNRSNFVRMEVEQEINEVKSIDPIVGPTTSKRKASTVVVVRDQQTVVIGGLITEKTKKHVTKIPLLGDLPLLGYLFKSTVKTQEKTNLLIFITPYIIRNEGDLRRIFQDKIKQRKEFIEKFGQFKDLDVDRNINYKHKYGFFEDINLSARNLEEEIELKAKAMEEYKEIDISGPIVVSEKAKQKHNGNSKSDKQNKKPRKGDKK